MGGLTLGWWIGVHDLNQGSSRLRIEGFTGHEQRRAWREYFINPGHEVRRHFDSGNRVRIHLGTLLSNVPGHPDSQPAVSSRIGNVRVRYAARAIGEYQCVIVERLIASDG